MRFSEIPPLYPKQTYAIDVSLPRVEQEIQDYLDLGLQLQPDFQRPLVWTPDQQTAFVEYLLRDGSSSRIIVFNHPGWMRSFIGDFVLVDGLQRLTAVCGFLANTIPAFGHFFREFTDRVPTGIGLRFLIASLPTHRAVLQWYLELNASGTPHSPQELQRVRALLAAEPSV